MEAPAFSARLIRRRLIDEIHNTRAPFLHQVQQRGEQLRDGTGHAALRPRASCELGHGAAWVTVAGGDRKAQVDVECHVIIMRHQPVCALEHS